MLQLLEMFVGQRQAWLPPPCLRPEGRRCAVMKPRGGIGQRANTPSSAARGDPGGPGGGADPGRPLCGPGARLTRGDPLVDSGAGQTRGDPLVAPGACGGGRGEIGSGRRGPFPS